MILSLVQTDGGQRVDPLPTRTSLGRAPGNTVVLSDADDRVLDQHAVLETDPGGVRLAAMDARAELVVNGNPVPNNTGLAPGDTITLGAASWRLEARPDPRVRDDTPWQLHPGAHAPEGPAISVEDALVVGREDAADLQLLHGYVSRRHARLLLAGGALWVSDLQSANGTFVNGRGIQGSAMVHPGDVLRFDEVEYRVSGPDLEPPQAAATMIRPPPEQAATAADDPPRAQAETPAASADDAMELELDDPAADDRPAADPAGEPAAATPSAHPAGADAEPPAPDTAADAELDLEAPGQAERQATPEPASEPPAAPAADPDPELDLDDNLDLTGHDDDLQPTVVAAPPAEQAAAPATPSDDLDDDLELDLPDHGDVVPTVVSPAAQAPVSAAAAALMSDEERHRQALIEQGIDPDEVAADAGDTMVAAPGAAPAASTPQAGDIAPTVQVDASSPGQCPQLLVLAGPEPGTAYSLRSEVRMIMGRAPECDIVLPETSVSSRHCQCQVRGDRLHVENLISSNGIFVNGERITEAELRNGDTLQLGRIEMVFELQPGSAAHLYSARKGLPPWAWMLLGFGVAATVIFLTML